MLRIFQAELVLFSLNFHYVLTFCLNSLSFTVIDELGLSVWGSRMVNMYMILFLILCILYRARIRLVPLPDIRPKISKKFEVMYKGLPWKLPYADHLQPQQSLFFQSRIEEDKFFFELSKNSIVVSNLRQFAPKCDHFMLVKPIWDWLVGKTQRKPIFF